MNFERMWVLYNDMVLENTTHFLARRRVPLRLFNRRPLVGRAPDPPIRIGSPMEMVGGGGRTAEGAPADEPGGRTAEGAPADEPGERVGLLAAGAVVVPTGGPVGVAVSILATAGCDKRTRCERVQLATLDQ